VDYRGRRDVYKFVWFRSQISDKGVILVDSIDPSVGHPLQQRMRRWNRNVGYSYSSHKTLKRGSTIKPTKSAAAKFLIFDLTISNDRPSLETSKSKISALSDLPLVKVSF